MNLPAPACQGPSGGGEDGPYNTHTHIYIRRPLLARCHQAARDGFEVTSQRSRVTGLLIKSVSDRSPVCWYHQIWGQPVWDLLVVGTPGLPIYPPADVSSQLGVSLGRPWNSLKFQGISKTSENHQSGLPRPPKVSKIMSKWVPKILNFTKNTKMWNLLKTTINW